MESRAAQPESYEPLIRPDNPARKARVPRPPSPTDIRPLGVDVGAADAWVPLLGQWRRLTMRPSASPAATAITSAVVG